MEKTELTYTDHNIFLIKMLIWLGFAGLGFLMALFGFFYPLLVWLALALAGFFFVRFAFQRNIFPLISKEFWISGIIILLVAISFSFFSTPTVFSGRDQGSISEAAIRLAQNHKLEFATPTSQAFFGLRGPGKALNFPGFYYQTDGNLITQFPIVYISWLALFFSVFGTYGLVLANTVLFAIFLMTFYLLLRLFVSKKFATVGMIFALTSFGIFWFTKLTLSENMALPLVWLSVFSLILFWREQNKLYFTSLLLSLFLLCFSRIEGFAFLAMSIILVFFNQNMRAFVRDDMKRRFYFPLMIMTALLATDMWVNLPFFKEIVKALLPAMPLPKAQLLGTIENVALPSWYFIKIYALYGMLGFFIFAILGIIMAFKKGITEKVAPILLVAPTLLYFYDSHITPDHPWMLRRFMFSLLPVAVFYSTIFLSKLNFHYKRNIIVKSLITFVIIFLIGMNMPAFLKYIAYSENKGLLNQLGNLSGNFQPNSLVLIDRNASGDGWNMLDQPLSSLYGINSAYFFSTQDLTKLDLSHFNKIYLLTNQKDSASYLNSEIGNDLTPVSNFTLHINKLAGSSDDPFEKTSLPEKITTDEEISIFQISKQ